MKLVGKSAVFRASLPLTDNRLTPTRPPTAHFAGPISWTRGPPKRYAERRSPPKCCAIKSPSGNADIPRIFDGRRGQRAQPAAHPCAISGEEATLIANLPARAANFTFTLRKSIPMASDDASQKTTLWRIWAATRPRAFGELLRKPGPGRPISAARRERAPVHAISGLGVQCSGITSEIKTVIARPE